MPWTLLEHEMLRFVRRLPTVLINSINLSELPSDNLFGAQEYGEPITANDIDCSLWGTTQELEYSHVLHETLKTNKGVIYTVLETIRFTEIMLDPLENTQYDRVQCRLNQIYIGNWRTTL